MAPVIMGNPDRPELTQSFCRTDPAIARQFARVTFLSDNRTDLPLVRTPAFSQDVIAPQEVGAYVQRHLTGSRLVTFQATGHFPNLTDARRRRPAPAPSHDRVQRLGPPPVRAGIAAGQERRRTGHRRLAAEAGHPGGRTGPPAA